MKIALLSDIHSNAWALEHVLNEAKQNKATHLLIAGDFVDYYYEIDKVFELLANWSFDAIAGNHDVMLLNWLENKENKTFFKLRFGSGLERAHQVLSDEQIKWLTNLAITKELLIDNKRVFICHGSPWSHDQYIYPDCGKEMTDKLFQLGYDLIVYGHTHHPVVHQNDHQLIVNPGSIGQPRDGKTGASWALWDTETHQAILKRTVYDPSPIVKQCQKYDPHLPYLQKALTGDT